MINILKTEQNIITLSIDDREQETNYLNERFITHFETLVEEITRDNSIKGVILTSSKKDFLLNHDLLPISQMENTQSIFNYIVKLQKSLEMLDNWGKPIVAAISGPAFGAGFEVALACHHRVVINHHTISLQLSSPRSGLIPSLGTIQRLSRLLGIEQATGLLLAPKNYNPYQAWELGLVDALADTNTLMLEMACAWIEQNPSPPQRNQLKQEQDPHHPRKLKGKEFFQTQSHNILQSDMGFNVAKNQILERIYDGAYVPFVHACRADAASFANLFEGAMSKNTINILNFGIEDCRNWAKQKSKDQPTHSKVAILNPSNDAVQLVLKLINTDIEVAISCSDITSGETFKNKVSLALQELLEGNIITKDSKEFKLSLIEVFDNLDNLKNSSLVIDCSLKGAGSQEHIVEIEKMKREHAPILVVSTTQSKVEDVSLQSQCPQDWLEIDISNLNNESNFIELKRGAKTSGNNIVKSLKLLHDVGIIPIVTNDQRGSFSYSLKMAYIQESLICLCEGYNPYSIERSIFATGMTASPFQVIDELGIEAILESLHAIKKIDPTGQEKNFAPEYLEKISRFLNHRREQSSHYSQSLFYQRDESGQVNFRPPSFDFSSVQKSVGTDYQEKPKNILADRLILIQLAKALHLIEQKAIQSPIEADVASILGAHFPAYSGGILSYIQYHKAEVLIDRYEKLQKVCGMRFNPPKLLKQLASKGLKSAYELDQYFYSSRLEQDE